MSATFNGWATVDLNSSNGSKTTTWTGSEHTGRSARSVSVTYRSRNTASTITRAATITQTAANEFVKINTAGGTTISASVVSRTNVSGGETFAIAGKSNASGLKFEIISIDDASTSWIHLPANFTGDGNTIALTNGAGSIPGDPGRVSQYDYSISLTLDENTTITQRSVTFRVSSSSNASVYDEITITQTAGAAYLRINSVNTDPTESGQAAILPLNITIAASGGTGYVYTFSNCDWEVVLTVD